MRRPSTARRCVSHAPGHPNALHPGSIQGVGVGREPHAGVSYCPLRWSRGLARRDVRLTLWTHDPDELDFPRGVLDRAHWISKYSVLIVNGRMFNLGSPDARSACQYAEPAEAIECL